MRIGSGIQLHCWVLLLGIVLSDRAGFLCDQCKCLGPQNGETIVVVGSHTSAAR
jgi:hypothetical protein